jgi:hypothetical protein
LHAAIREECASEFSAGLDADCSDEWQLRGAGDLRRQGGRHNNKEESRPQAKELPIEELGSRA